MSFTKQVFIAPDNKQEIEIQWDGLWYQLTTFRPEQNYSSSLTLNKDQGTVFIQKLEQQGWKHGRSNIRSASKRRTRD